MKFLTKNRESSILKNGYIYKKNASRSNGVLCKILLCEQRNFCAYTEKHIESLDSCDIDHFNPALKYNDDYYNYYAVLHKANQYKQDEKYIKAKFFTTLFFQDKVQLQNRIAYRDGIYMSIDPEDTEAKDLIQFLGFNHEDLYRQRKNHIKRLKKHFAIAGFKHEDIIRYFKDTPEDMSFITAIESEFNITLEFLLEV